MYTVQIVSLRNKNIFESCTTEGLPSGINILQCVKIPSTINLGRHHLFVDLIANNEWYRGLDIKCLLNYKNFYGFTKPMNEVGCHIPIYGDNNNLSIQDNEGHFSQSLFQLSANHTEYGHSSYYIVASTTQTLPVNDTLKQSILAKIAELTELVNQL